MDTNVATPTSVCAEPKAQRYKKINYLNIINQLSPQFPSLHRFS